MAPSPASEARRSVPGPQLSDARIAWGLLEAAPDAIVAVDGDGRIALVNAQVEKLFGYHPEELLGQPVEILVPESARGIHMGHRDGYFTHPVTRPMGAGKGLAARRKDGSEFLAEISLSAIETESGLLVSAAIRDGSERKQAAIIASSNDAIISHAIDGTITSWNGGAERVYGYRAAEVLGRHIELIVAPGRHDEDRALRARVARGERIGEFETVHVRRDGSLVELAKTMAPIVDVRGAVVGVSTIGRDITERKRVENERRTLEERLNHSQRLESLGQLAGGIAHDFNNLLAVILNYASFAAEDIIDNEAAQADIEAIRTAAERAARLTQQLLTFARRGSIQPEVLDLNAVVDDVKSLLSRTIGEHVQLTVHLDDGLSAVRADRGQVEQVLMNVAVNARDAMKDGGTLTIETSMVHLAGGDDQLRPPVAAGRYVQLTVSDTGIGMSEEVAAHAFDPFFSTKPKGEGSGLGLATVYGIVAEANGTTTLYSEPGVGTTIRIYLPALDEPITARQPRQMVDAARGDGTTVLVVEDEPAMRAVTARILTRKGYTVLEAANGDEALALAGRHHCDLVLTDVVMPSMSGPELSERLRDRRPNLPVVFMSGYSHGVLGPRGLLDRNVALIEKPFDAVQLLQKIQSVLRGSERKG